MSGCVCVCVGADQALGGPEVISFTRVVVPISTIRAKLYRVCGRMRLWRERRDKAMKRVEWFVSLLFLFFSFRDG